MIRFMHCVRRRPDISELEFRRYWNSPEFDGLIRGLGIGFPRARVKRSLVLAVKQNETLREERAAELEPFDGILEVWFESAREIAGLAADDEYQRLMGEIAEFQSGFVDFAQSVRFFTEWEE